MDLWIRSQNKEIFRKANYLKIEKHDDELAIVEQATLYGKYKTKERALEVLDDIQSLLQGNSNTTLHGIYQYIGIISETSQNLIFEMPKE